MKEGGRKKAVKGDLRGRGGVRKVRKEDVERREGHSKEGYNQNITTW